LKAGLFGANRPISTLKTVNCGKYFIHTLSQFSQGNNALDAPDSNIEDFPCRDKCFSSNQWNKSTCSKQILSPSETPKLPLMFLCKSNSVLTRNQRAACSCFYHRWFSFEICMCFFNSAE
jgi:hypothetical protein